MSRLGKIVFVCLFVGFSIIFANYALADNALRLDEAAARVRFANGRTEVTLKIINPAGQNLPANARVELLDAGDGVLAVGERALLLSSRANEISLTLPFKYEDLSSRAQSELPWYRLRYRVNTTSEPTESVPAGCEGVLSLSSITPDLFNLKVSAAERGQPGQNYRARARAVHPATRKPLAGLKIEGQLEYSDGDGKTITAQAQTDAQGYAALDFLLPAQIKDDDIDINIKARRGDVEQTATSEFDLDTRLSALASTDKTLYQPGQTLHVRALVLTPGKRAAADADVTIEIDDERGEKVFQSAAKTSRFGIVKADWPIPDSAKLGDYTIEIQDDDDNQIGGQMVRVSRYDLPNFVVTAKPDRAYYLPGQNAEIVISADYLFGQPVKRGHARLVREESRRWDYEKQKWDISEADTQEGDTDEQGRYTARLDLREFHESLKDNGSERFHDYSYAAYYTDPTTRRTEQRRFNLRVTLDSIHLYLVKRGGRYRQHPSLPLEFYVAASYADGVPAPNCAITMRRFIGGEEGQPIATPVLQTITTNAYGVAKTNGLQLPEDAGGSEFDLLLEARDAPGNTGRHNENFYFHNENEVRMTAAKSLYRAGEPIEIALQATEKDARVSLDLLRGNSLLRSFDVPLKNGHGAFTIPYSAEFYGELRLAAYTGAENYNHPQDGFTVLYPRDTELKLDIRPDSPTHQPGEEAQVDFSVRAPSGQAAESALGVVIFDQAVAERARTNQEFGGAWGFANQNHGGSLGNLTRNGLNKLDLQKPFTPEMLLAAELLLNQESFNYSPKTFNGDNFDTEPDAAYSDSLRRQFQPLQTVFNQRYAQDYSYPRNENELRAAAAKAKLNYDAWRDPWGQPYRAAFSVNGAEEHLEIYSTGPDKQPQTGDDLTALSESRPYFGAYRDAVPRAAQQYHERTGAYLRDAATLKNELQRLGVQFDALRDPWGQPYRLKFWVEGARHRLSVSSDGPNRAGPDKDDLTVAEAGLDYFAELGRRMEGALTGFLEMNQRYPLKTEELRAALQTADIGLDCLRDPWGNSYFAAFAVVERPADKPVVETRAEYGKTGQNVVTLAPATQKTFTVRLYSPGPDGKEKTGDDFPVFASNAYVTEQSLVPGQNNAAKPAVVWFGVGGAIGGIVTDPNGAFVPGAKVTATRAVTNEIYETEANAEGVYLLAKLPPGVYQVRVNSPGFNPSVFSNVLVKAATKTQLDATLQVGAASATVDVTAASDDAGVNFSLSTTSTTTNIAALPADPRRFTAEFGRATGAAPQIATPRLREYFPETLVWQPELITDAGGRARLKFKFADNITTWRMSVIGSTVDGQIGLAEQDLRAFQPFFAEHDPPRILTQGDEITLPVVLRNYLEKPQAVSVNMKPENWFSLLGAATQRANAPAGDAAKVFFPFRATAPVTDGKQRVTALGVSAGDAIEKPVTVHPDGEELAAADSALFSDSATLLLDVRADAIPNSLKGQVKVYPNLMAHVGESVTGLLQRPHGCGEQTISSTYPNLLILRYERGVGGKFPQHEQAERYLREGYRRLLNYRHASGGFTYWGEGDPDLALTAYALRFLTDAQGFVGVDDDVTDAARDWLIRQQQADGSWAVNKYGDQAENEARSRALTAYLARVLAKAESKTAPSKALAYLAPATANTKDAYFLASFALAAQTLGDKPQAARAVARLRELARTDATTTSWTANGSTPFYGWGLAGDIETTALALQALAQQADPADSALISRALFYLLKNKDRYGVWHSTQATANVLDALLGQITAAQDAGDQPATVLVNGQNAGALTLPPPGRAVAPVLLDVAAYLKPGRNVIVVNRAPNAPPASAQAVANYYVPWHQREPSGDLRLNVSYDKTETHPGDAVTCNVRVTRAGYGYGMLLAEIGLPPGADVDLASLEEAQKDGRINRYDALPDRVAVYVWPYYGQNTVFNFKFRPRYGLNAQTAPSVLYDYYNPESRAVVAPTRFIVR